MSNPDVYNKIVGLNGLQGLPTYEEHLILNGSKSSLQKIDREKNHDRDRGSNNQVNQNRYQQISHSKQSLQYRNGSLMNMFGGKVESRKSYGEHVRVLEPSKGQMKVSFFLEILI